MQVVSATLISHAAHPQRRSTSFYIRCGAHAVASRDAEVRVKPITNLEGIGCSTARFKLWQFEGRSSEPWHGLLESFNTRLRDKLLDVEFVTCEDHERSFAIAL